MQISHGRLVKMVLFLVIILVGVTTGYYLNSTSIINKNQASSGRTLECSFPLSANVVDSTKIRIDALEASSGTDNSTASIIASSPDTTTIANLEKFDENGVKFGKYIFRELSSNLGGFKCRMTITDSNVLDGIANKSILNCPIVIETEEPIICPINTPSAPEPSITKTASPNPSPSPVISISVQPTPTSSKKGKCGDVCTTSFDCDSASGSTSCLIASDRGYCSCPITPSPIQSPTIAIKSPTPTSTLTPTKTPTLTPTPTQVPSCLQTCSSDSNCASGLKCLQVGSVGKRCVLNTACKASTTQTSCWCFPPSPTPSPTRTPTPSLSPSNIPSPTPRVTVLPTISIPVCPAPVKVSSVTLSCQTSTCSFTTVAGASAYYVKITTIDGKSVVGFEKPVKLSAEEVRVNGAKISFNRVSGQVYQCAVATENSCGSSMPVVSTSCGVIEPTTKVVDGGKVISKTPPLVISSPPTVVTGPSSERIIQNPPAVIVKDGGVITKSGGTKIVTTTPVVGAGAQVVPSGPVVQNPAKDLPQAGIIENAGLLLLFGASILVFGFLL